MMKSKTINTIRRSFLFLNFIAILYNATLYLFATRYISEMNYAHALLENLTTIPGSPVRQFILSMIFALILTVTIWIRDNTKNDNRIFDGFLILEFILSAGLIYILKDSYNGFIFLVFMDLIYHSRDSKYWLYILFTCFGLFIVSNYNLLSQVIDMPSLDVYIRYFPHRLYVVLSFFRSLLDVGSIVLFIVFLVSYLLTLLEEQKNTEEEVNMLSRVNAELKNYVSLSEKNAEDRERKRISREIHDTLGHALTGISAGIDACIVLMDIDQDKAKQQLQIVSTVVREGIRDVRRSLMKLRPGALENQTLKDAVLKMIHEFEAVSHVDVHLYYGWDQVDLDHTREDVVFRVIQESMTNAVRHGQATRIDVEMYADETEYTIIVQDNGTGCDHVEYGYGLTQMKERLAMIGARVQFISVNGFRVIVEIPVRKGEEKL